MLLLQNDLRKGSINMERECISVIIPIYNTEPYLERCLNSVLNSTLNIPQQLRGTNRAKLRSLSV